MLSLSGVATAASPIRLEVCHVSHHTIPLRSTSSAARACNLLFVPRAAYAPGDIEAVQNQPPFATPPPAADGKRRLHLQASPFRRQRGTGRLQVAPRIYQQPTWAALGPQFTVNAAIYHADRIPRKIIEASASFALSLTAGDRSAPGRSQY